MICAVNIWAVSMMRYRTGILNWMKNIDRKTMKGIVQHITPRDSVDRIYINRKNGGKGLKA